MYPALLIDTETSGLPDYKRPADAPGQPRMAEFAGILIDADGEVESEYQRYIKPEGWSMTPEATEINGITDEMLHAEGVPVAEVLDFYAQHIQAGRMIIAYGAQFDCKVMRAELRIAGRDDLFKHTRNVCLMRQARPFAKIIGREIIKAGGNNKGWPKLTDLANFLGAIYEPDQLHGALMDARLATVCYRLMLDQGFKAEPEVHHAKDYETIRSAK